VAESVRIIRKPKIEEVEEEDITSADSSADRIEEELKRLEENTKEEPFDEDDEIPF